jgi:hypothetical protein
MKHLLFLLLIALPAFAKAQNVKTATIQWNSQSTMDPGTGHQTEEPTSFVTHGTSRIEWKESNGNSRKNFQIVETIGEWTNASQQGWLQYEITDGTSSGTISIRKNESETKVFISLASDPPLSYVLTIAGLQTL